MSLCIYLFILFLPKKKELRLTLGQWTHYSPMQQSSSSIKSEVLFISFFPEVIHFLFQQKNRERIHSQTRLGLDGPKTVLGNACDNTKAQIQSPNLGYYLLLLALISSQIDRLAMYFSMVMWARAIIY